MSLQTSPCEIVLVRSSADADGYTCGSKASAECADCGTSICDLHTESCDECHQLFCVACMYQHMNEPHSKPVVASHKQARRRLA